MSIYLEMWAEIKSTTESYRREFLEDYGPAVGKNVLYYKGIYFDVDLLEAVRNSLE